jgi:hypothetical protein
MRKILIVIAAVAAAGLLAAPAFLQEPPPPPRLLDITPVVPVAYEMAPGWPQPFAASGFAFGGNSGVAVESPDRIFVVQRGETRLPDPVPSGFQGFAGSIGINTLRQTDLRVFQNVIYVVNGDGDIIEVWDQWDELFQGAEGPGPHRIRISPYDPEKRVWVVDESQHQFFVFSNDGSELLHTFGEKGVPGNDETHLAGPQDVAFTPDGRVLVADGFINGRVMILDADLSYITEFGGEPGDGRGRFNRVHSVAVGPDGRIFVADRDNRRVQVFNETTRSAWYHPNISPIGTWPGFDLPLDIIVNQYDVWVTNVGPDGASIIKFDLNGNPQTVQQLPTEGPGVFTEMHSFAVDSEGTLYGADNQQGRVQKLVPKADADPALLIDPAFVADGQ